MLLQNKLLATNTMKFQKYFRTYPETKSIIMLHHLTDLNWLAILAGGVAYFVLGALWYSPMLFIKPWLRLSGINMNDPEAKKGAAMIMLASFILMFFTCIGLAWLRQQMGISDLQSSLHIGLLTGICFSAPSLAITYAYNKKPLMLYFIDCGYHVAGIPLASVMMQVVG